MENTEHELYHYLALTRVAGIGPILGRNLVSYCGGAQAVFKENTRRLAQIPGISTVGAEAIKSFRQWDVIEKELNFIDKYNIRALPYTHTEYPTRLKQVADSPIVLFVKGNADLNHKRMVAIVGTRKNTRYGIEMTNRLVEGLKALEAHVVSGLAIGIDIAAHRACNENDIPTLAVMAHGLDMIYPSRHKADAIEMISKGGGIVSEFFSGTEMHPDLFPRRNRIVAGMCDALVVVESKVRGGSMITVEIASSYNRDVFAVPGRCTDSMSEGCNALIKSLKAALCTSADDIAYGMNWESGSKKKRALQPSLFIEMSEEERLVAEILSKGELAYDNLLVQSNIPMNKLTFTLFEMEMKNLLRVLPGKVYELTR